jgi:hypothetical protein
MTSKAKELDIAIRTCIFCWNEHILGTRVFLEMEAKSYKVFPFPCHGKPIFYFQSAETRFFVKQLLGVHSRIQRNVCTLIEDNI